jgi:hypothetical protein
LWPHPQNSHMVVKLSYKKLSVENTELANKD